MRIKSYVFIVLAAIIIILQVVALQYSTVLSSDYDIEFNYIYTWNLKGTKGDINGYREEVTANGHYTVHFVNQIGGVTADVLWEWSKGSGTRTWETNNGTDHFNYVYSLSTGEYIVGNDHEFNKTHQRIWFHVPGIASGNSFKILNNTYQKEGNAIIWVKDILPINGIKLISEGSYNRADEYDGFVATYTIEKYVTKEGYLIEEKYTEHDVEYDPLFVGVWPILTQLTYDVYLPTIAEFDLTSSIYIISASYVRPINGWMYSFAYIFPIIALLITFYAIPLINAFKTYILGHKNQTMIVQSPNANDHKIQETNPEKLVNEVEYGKEFIVESEEVPTIFKITENLTTFALQEIPIAFQEESKFSLEVEGETILILGQITQGGMGRIYAGKNLERNEKVIVKKLKADKYFNAWGESSCEDYWNREKILIKKQARCSPNAMHLMGAVKRDIEGRTEYFLILEYIAGPSLEKWYHEFLRENTISSLTQIHDLIKLVILPLCNHLKAVHQAGIVHRDITPRNIIMNFRDNRIYPILIDWGVAKEIPLEQLYSVPKPFITEIRTVATGILSVGTPPEIIAGFRPVAASDIYMFGHIIYYLITGNSSRQIPLSQAEYELCPKTVNAVVPVKLDKLVRNMTKYEPADRIPSMEQVERVLIECIDHGEIV